MAAAPGGSRLQHMLQSAVQSVQWTYSLFWQFCPQQGMLIWADGYYNGAIKTRKTVQPMEVTAEEASLQRSQQLRELYDSLSAAETDQPPARRPCASLSPEDLTESEWYYLMCVSFSFPLGIGLPGKAYTKRQHVWLTGANEVDSKVFSRAILAKSARVQTVVCIPLMDGVVEVGTTERVQEDTSLIQHIKTFFADHHYHPPPKPALSEHSTSNPAAASSSNHPSRFHSPPLPAAMYSSPGAVDPAAVRTNEAADVDDNDVDAADDEEDNDVDVGSDSGAETAPTAIAGGGRGKRKRPSTTSGGQFNVAGNQGLASVAPAEPSEIMQLEMSEDIRIGSPDDASNNLESNFRIMGQMAAEPGSVVANQQRRADSFRAESSRRWPVVMQDQPSNPLLQHQPLPGASLDDLSQEDTHYSQTVSTILQYQTTRWSTESASGVTGYLAYSTASSFAKWSPRSDLHAHLPAEGTSQWLLKYVLLTVPLLHTKYRDDSTPPKPGEQQITNPNLRLRSKGAPQDDLMSANHVLAERRRREKLNERFIILRSLVPFVTKMDKASILGDTIEYVKQLRRKIQDLETRTRQMETERLRLLDASKSAAAAMPMETLPQQRASTTTTTTNSSSLLQKDQRSGSGTMTASADRARVGPVGSQDRRKMRAVEEAGTAKPRAVVEMPPSPPPPSDMLQVSIIESDGLIELHCPYKEGLLLDVMLMLREMRVEVTSVQSSMNNGFFIAELRAKVRENASGKKASIIEVKKAINHIVPHTTD